MFLPLFSSGSSDSGILTETKEQQQNKAADI